MDFERAQVLTAERDMVLDYQTKLDEARERLEAGDLTQDEFDRLHEELVADMPEAVRNQIPELANQQPETQHDTQSTANEATLVIDDDMVPTSFTPTASGPSPVG